MLNTHEISITFKRPANEITQYGTLAILKNISGDAEMVGTLTADNMGLAKALTGVRTSLNAYGVKITKVIVDGDIDITTDDTTTAVAKILGLSTGKSKTNSQKNSTGTTKTRAKMPQIKVSTGISSKTHGITDNYTGTFTPYNPGGYLVPTKAQPNGVFISYETHEMVYGAR